MRRLHLFILLATGLVAVFFADRVNRDQLRRVLKNAAGGEQPMKAVTFVFPLIPHPTPSVEPPPVYPPSVRFDSDLAMKYQDLGGGYWQTEAFNLLSGAPCGQDNDWQGHFRFKFNPSGDPLHPGHSLVAVSGARDRVVFANLGKVDFDKITNLRGIHWLIPAAAETAAVWHLEPGTCIALRIDTELSGPPASASSQNAFDPSDPKPVVIHRQTYAKVFVRKLSYESVRFDYVYQTNGKDFFPKPNLAGQAP